MNYTSLNKTQKKLVDAFVSIKPDLADASTITRETIEDLFAILYDKRANGGEKFGYPNWIVKDQKISRGIYRFPGPNASNVIEISQNKSEKKDYVEKECFSSSEIEKEFLKDILRYGIINSEEIV